jgi:hypothetical protein
MINIIPEYGMGYFVMPNVILSLCKAKDYTTM